MLTKDDLEKVEQITNKNLLEAVDTILKGIDNIILETRNGFKQISENFATKEDLSREVGWVRDDIKGLTADLVDTVSKKEHNKLKMKVDKYLVD